MFGTHFCIEEGRPHRDTVRNTDLREINRLPLGQVLHSWKPTHCEWNGKGIEEKHCIKTK